MSQDLYYKKYLKYKQKYLALANKQQKSGVKVVNQKGGYWGINIISFATLVTRYGSQRPTIVAPMQHDFVFNPVNVSRDPAAANADIYDMSIIDARRFMNDPNINPLYSGIIHEISQNPNARVFFIDGFNLLRLYAEKMGDTGLVSQLKALESAGLDLAKALLVIKAESLGIDLGKLAPQAAALGLSAAALVSEKDLNKNIDNKNETSNLNNNINIITLFHFQNSVRQWFVSKTFNSIIFYYFKL